MIDQTSALNSAGANPPQAPSKTYAEGHRQAAHGKEAHNRHGKAVALSEDLAATASEETTPGNRALAADFHRLRDAELATRRLAHAIAKYAHRVDRLEDKAERIAEKLFERMAQDVRDGNFNDDTAERAVEKALHRLNKIGLRFGELAGRTTNEVLRAIGKEVAAGSEDIALSFELQQSFSVSVESVEIQVSGDSGDVAVNYQRLSFSMTTTLGLQLATRTPDAVDGEGTRVATATLQSGLYFDAALLQVQQTTSAGGEATDPTDGGANDEANDLTDVTGLTDGFAQGDLSQQFGGLQALLLVREANSRWSLDFSRILLDAAAKVPPSQDVGGAAVAEQGEAIDVDA